MLDDAGYGEYARDAFVGVGDAFYLRRGVGGLADQQRELTLEAMSTTAVCCVRDEEVDAIDESLVQASSAREHDRLLMLGKQRFLGRQQIGEV